MIRVLDRLRARAYRPAYRPPAPAARRIDMTRAVRVIDRIRTQGNRK